MATAAPRVPAAIGRMPVNNTSTGVFPRRLAPWVRKQSSIPAKKATAPLNLNERSSGEILVTQCASQRFCRAATSCSERLLQKSGEGLMKNACQMAHRDDEASDSGSVVFVALVLFMVHW